MKILDVTNDEKETYMIIDDHGNVMATCHDDKLSQSLMETISAHIDHNGLAKPILEIQTDRDSFKDGIGAIAGRKCKLKVGGVYTDGLIKKNINFEPSEVATLTITMVLPEIRYLDDK